MTTRDILFEFMSLVTERDTVALTDASKLIAAMLNIDYNFFNKGNRFDERGFREALMGAYERYLEVYKLKDKSFEDLDEDSRNLILGSFASGCLMSIDDVDIVPYCSYSITIALIGGLIIDGIVVHALDKNDELQPMILPCNDSIIREVL